MVTCPIADRQWDIERSLLYSVLQSAIYPFARKLRMPAFEDIKPGARLRGLDPGGIAEVVQVARFGPDALNLVFRVNGRVGERLVYRGEESGFEFFEATSWANKTPRQAAIGRGAQYLWTAVG
jgi:hypothetical protein